MMMPIRSMARAFVLSALYYLEGETEVVETFHHADLAVIPPGKYAVVHFKLCDAGTDDRLARLFEGAEVPDHNPT